MTDEWELYQATVAAAEHDAAQRDRQLADIQAVIGTLNELGYMMPGYDEANTPEMAHLVLAALTIDARGRV